MRLHHAPLLVCLLAACQAINLGKDIPDGGAGAPDGGSGTPDSGSGTLDGGSGTLDGGSGTPDGGPGSPDSGFSCAPFSSMCGTTPSVILTCNPNGTAYVESECSPANGYDSVCVAGACAPIVCSSTPDADGGLGQRCDGNLAQACNATGTGWVTLSVCTASDPCMVGFFSGIASCAGSEPPDAASEDAGSDEEETDGGTATVAGDAGTGDAGNPGDEGAGTNPCAVNNGGCTGNALCQFANGTVTCGCPAGYVSNGQFGSALVCMSACTIANGGCGSNATCSIANGAVACTCEPGFVSGGQSGTALTCTPASGTDAGADGGLDGGTCGAAAGEPCCPGSVCIPNGELICVLNECIIDDNWTHWKGSPPDVPPASQYSVSADGTTATDSVTNLLWQRIGTCGGGWTGALECCHGLSLGGFSTGWRVPTLVEMTSIGIYDGTQDLTVFPPANNDGWYWASSLYGNNIGAWNVSFPAGDTAGGAIVGESTPAMCVHSLDGPGVVGTGPGAPPGRYVITNGGTTDGAVYDVVTQLTWQQIVPDDSYAWSSAGAVGSAQAYCGNLSLGGFTSGWRLPSVKELASIVDAEAYNPAIAPAFLTMGASASYGFWTASSTGGLETSAWNIDFIDGSTNSTAITSLLGVRCVR